ncbi:MAG: insulinase family protein [Rhizobiales bacterium]|nr:insulinase family protein [Hyphomicrobiales bacterium]
MLATRIVVAALLLLAFFLPARALDIDVTNFKLENGMEVVVIPDRRAPVVTHMVWYRVGSADEVSGKSGLAHFLEHLLFKGTKKHPPGEFNRIIDVNGGEDNAFTSRDYTAYFQRIASDRLELVMELEADRMQNLVLTDENVIPELDVVREERRERTENDPSSLLQEQVEAAMYTAHPYGRPVIGWMSEVAQLTKEDALAFYRAHYTPANAILIVAGDVDADQVKRLAGKHYGALKNSFEPMPRKRTPEPAPIAARRVEMKDPRVSSVSIQRSYLAPTSSTAEGLEAEALDVLAQIVGGGSQSRLYKRLVVENSLAAYTGAWYGGDGLDYGTFGVYAAPVPGADVAKVEAEIDTVLAEVVAKGVTQDELDRARTKLLADSVYALDSQSSLARMFGAALTTGSTVADVLGWERDVEALKPEDLAAAARKVIDSRRSVTGILRPETQTSN